MKSFLGKKIIISAAAISTVFILFVFSIETVKAEHLKYEYNSSLNEEDNYNKAGHPELYKARLREIQDKNYNLNTEEGRRQKALDERTIFLKDFNNSNSTILKNSGSGNFTYTLLQPLPTEGRPLNENVTLTEYLTWIYRFTLAMAGFLAVLMIVIGGVEYIASGANEKLRSDAHSRIENALWGLALALAAYLILYTINPKLVNFENNEFFKEKTTTR